MQRAITFDFWDTIVIDESDEPKRASKGLDSKAVTRRRLFVDDVLGAYPTVPVERVNQAFDECNRRFKTWWKVYLS